MAVPNPAARARPRERVSARRRARTCKYEELAARGSCHGTEPEPPRGGEGGGKLSERVTYDCSYLFFCWIYTDGKHAAGSDEHSPSCMRREMGSSRPHFPPYGRLKSPKFTAERGRGLGPGRYGARLREGSTVVAAI